MAETRDDADAPDEVPVDVVTSDPGVPRPASSPPAAPEDPFRRPEAASELLPAVSGEGGPDSGNPPLADRIAAEQAAIRGRGPTPTAGTHRGGEVIDGRYILVRPIDVGGMGVVWLAHSIPLEMDVALKLTHGWRSGTIAAKRMAREARSAAMLTHPAVVRIFDFGQVARGEPYLAMELLRGRSLGRELDKRGPMTPERAVALLLPVADALVAAHDRGIVHRDLKPDNVFLARGPGGIEPKLLDFSLVKLVERSISSTELTADGRGLGTAPYLSPEQVQGRSDVDRRTDVWALCAVLYRCTTGRAPFQGTTAYDLVHAVVDAEPVPTVELGVGDRAFWRILRRGFEKDPNDRHDSMRELGRELAAWALAHGVTEDATHVCLESKWLDRARTRTPLVPVLLVALAFGLGCCAGAAAHYYYAEDPGASRLPHAP